MKISHSPLLAIAIMTITLAVNRHFQCSYALNNNLAFTPPMGWCSWERFRCNIDCLNYPNECISEKLYREMADKMVEDGYLDAGYQYILMDDCWLAKSRDSQGRLQADPQRFPSGLKNLSHYIHSKGLKFGIYEDYGTYTCEGYPGVRDHTMAIDANMFLYWEVDYVKLDGCYCDPMEMDKGYPEFGKYLRATGRPMVYSCSWPFYQSNMGISPNYSAIADSCNLWRNYGDVQDSWQSVRDIMNYYGDHQEEFAQYAGPQHWNDPDMLIIGNFGLSYEQAKSQMVIWAMLSAPLMMSHDLRKVNKEFRSLLLNPDLISVNQDPLGIQGKRIFINRKKKFEVWSKPVLPLARGLVSWAFAFVNVDDSGELKTCTFPLKYSGLCEPYSLYEFIDFFDPFRKCDVGKKRLTVRIPPSGSALIKAELRSEGDNPLAQRRITS